MPIKKDRNPLEPRAARTAAANAARWQNHVPLTEEERLVRKKEYYRRAREKLKDNKPVNEPAVCEVKTDEILGDSEKPEVDGDDLGEKPVRRGPQRADRANSMLAKTLEGEAAFSRRARIAELERVCGLNAGEETIFAGIFSPHTPPNEPRDFIEEDPQNYEF
jgi:hypothetical protein